MEPFYAALFGVAAVLAAVLEYGNRAGRNAPGNTTREFTMFRNNYLLVYSLMMGEPAAISMPVAPAPHQIHPPPLPANRARGFPPPALPQPETGCRAPTSTPCTSTTASSGATSASSSSPALAPLWCLAPLWAAWRTSSACRCTAAPPGCLDRWSCPARSLEAPVPVQLHVPACAGAGGCLTARQRLPASTRPASLLRRLSSPQRPQARGPDLLRDLHPGLLHQALQQLLDSGGGPRAVWHRHLPPLLRL